MVIRVERFWHGRVLGMMNIPLQMMVVALAGWVNEQQLAVIVYVKEENRVLREQLGKKRLRPLTTSGDESERYGKGNRYC